jgi:PQQ-dependent catabolism-associated beta-propeller protein
MLEKKVLFEVPVGVEPEGIAVSPSGEVAVATSETTNMVHFIKLDNFDIFDNVLVAARPRVAEFSPDGQKLWVTSEVGGIASVIDLRTRKVEKEIRFEIQGVNTQHIQPVGVRFTKDGKTAFIALGPANRIAVVDTATAAIKKYVLVGQRVWHMALTPDDQLLFTTNGGSNDVTVINVGSLTPVKSIKVGRQPWGAAAIAR